MLERQGVIDNLAFFPLLVNVAVVTGGSILLMWLGELISEFGIGNGVSIIIFAGIVAAIPSLVGQTIFTFDISQIPLYLAFLSAAFLVVAELFLSPKPNVLFRHIRQARAGEHESLRRSGHIFAVAS